MIGQHLPAGECRVSAKAAEPVGRHRPTWPEAFPLPTYFPLPANPPVDVSRRKPKVGAKVSVCVFIDTSRRRLARGVQLYRQGL